MCVAWGKIPIVYAEIKGIRADAHYSPIGIESFMTNTLPISKDQNASWCLS